MTIKDKELLLKDLCCRLPYNVKCNINDNKPYTLCSINYSLVGFKEQKNGFNMEVYISEVKPYLFPLSSMTKEQKHELLSLTKYESRCEESCGFDSCGHYIDIVGEYEYEDNKESIILYPNSIGIDWCNKNNFDYRGLIPKGLAIDATNLNIY